MQRSRARTELLAVARRSCDDYAAAGDAERAAREVAKAQPLLEAKGGDEGVREHGDSAERRDERRASEAVCCKVARFSENGADEPTPPERQVRVRQRLSLLLVEIVRELRGLWKQCASTGYGVSKC